MVGLITNNDETAYSEEVRTLAEWCLENNLHPHRRCENLQVPWCTHHWQPEMVHPNRPCVEEGATAHLQPQKTEEIWPDPSNPYKLLQMHHWEHPVGLYHRLIQQLHCLQLHGSPEGGAVSPRHHWGHTDIYSTWCHRKAKKIIKDLSYGRFTLLPSRRQRPYRCIKAGTERLKNSFYLHALRLLNSQH